MRVLLIILVFCYTLICFAQKDNSSGIYETAIVNTVFEDEDDDNTLRSGIMFVPENLESSYYQNFQFKLALKAYTELDYLSAINIYENFFLEEKNHKNINLIRLIADSYYYNLDFEKSYEWYNKIFKINKSEMSASDLYKYSQILIEVGKYSKSIKVLKEYSKKINFDTKVLIDSFSSKNTNYKISKLKINTVYNDFSPTFGKGGNLIFSSVGPNKSQNLYNVSLVEVNSEKAFKLVDQINSKDDETSSVFTSDQKIIYFTRSFLKKSINGKEHKIIKIFKSNYINNEWTEATPVSFSSDFYSTGCPALNSDETKMYFASDMPGSIGGSDIFVVDIFDDGTFSKAKNLGPTINTSFDEVYPFYINGLLYFSSDGHGGYGNLDIYEYKLDYVGKENRILNLGRTINSSSDDFSFIIDSTFKSGYFASNREGGEGLSDIYGFSINAK